MSDFEIHMNDDEILAALVEPFHRANEALGVAFANEITAKKWEWPGETTRTKGEVVGSPRDIVDLGDLRRSYVGKREAGLPTPEHSHTWSMDYAMAVHEGAKFQDGHTTPARPWTKKPLETNVLENAFEKYVGPELGKIL